MNRLFRQRGADLANWASLAVFAVAYLLALALVLMPGVIKTLITGAP